MLLEDKITLTSAIRIAISVAVSMRRISFLKDFFSAPESLKLGGNSFTKYTEQFLNIFSLNTIQMFWFLNFNLALLQGPERLDYISEHLYQVLQYKPMVQVLVRIKSILIPPNLAGNVNITNVLLLKKSRSMTLVAKLTYILSILTSV